MADDSDALLRDMLQRMWLIRAFEERVIEPCYRKELADEERVRDLGGLIEVISNSFDDRGLDLVCRDPIGGASLFGSALQEGRSDIVPVLDVAPSRMARCVADIARSLGRRNKSGSEDDMVIMSSNAVRNVTLS